MACPLCLSCRKKVLPADYRAWSGRHRACYFDWVLELFGAGLDIPVLPPYKRRQVRT